MIETSAIGTRRLSSEEIKGILQQHYGLKLSVKALPGYIDQNFYLEDEQSQGYVFKVCLDPDSYDELDFQNQAMVYLNENEPSVMVPNCLPNLKGDLITVLELSQGTVLARLLSYLPGTFMVDVADHSNELLCDIGAYFGRIDRCLKNFYHPSAYQYKSWDLKQAYKVVSDRITYIEDPQKCILIQYFLDYYSETITPLLNHLPCSVIHNDANDYNILVCEQDDKQRVCGTIDFGDMVHSHTVNELAIAITYAIFYKKDPIDAACQVIKGYHQALPLQEVELDVLFGLIAIRLCASIAISAESYSKNPENEYLLISQPPAWKLLQTIKNIDPYVATEQFYRVCGMRRRLPLAKADIIAYRQQHMGRTLSLSYQAPLKIVRGSGQYLIDEKGQRYLDMVNNVCHVGHCHPQVVAAGQKQMALLNTNTRYLHDNIVHYAQRLLATLPDSLSVVMFVNSGSEANELALRLARCHTRQKDMLVVEGAYHGNTQGCIDISPYKFDGPGGSGAVDWVHKVMLPDPYRGPYKGMLTESAEQYAKDVNRVLASLLDAGKKPCAFICESLQGVAGQIIMPPGYLQAVYDRIRQEGGVCIADEVQVGFGRVGTHMWAFETQAVVPDIVTMGKPIGNGHPMAAVVTTQEIAESFITGMEYFNTFGGNPVSCAIGLAVLDVIEAEGLMQQALQVGEYMREGLRALQEKHELIGDVRGLGLFNGVELVRDRETLQPAKEELAAIIEKMKAQHILLSSEGPHHNVLKIKPPMVFSRENADEFLQKLDGVLGGL